MIHAQGPPQQGIMSQIATTAAGVAIGQTAGRMLTGLFTSGSEVVNSTPSNDIVQTNHQTALRCEADTKKFVDCMSAHHDDLNACYSYYEMMKACQAQAHV